MSEVWDVTKKFMDDLEGALDADLKLPMRQGDVQLQVVLLTQILRELRKEGPEEKSAPVKGFTA